MRRDTLFLAIIGLMLALTGCASQFGPAGMSPEQMREWAKVKDASLYCIKATYAGANILTTGFNIDKGLLPTGVTVNDSCETTFMQAPR